MSLEKVSAFYEKLSSDEKFRTGLEEALTGVPEEKKLEVIIGFAEKSGYDITAEELESYMRKTMEDVFRRSQDASEKIGEMDPEQMEQVAGGKRGTLCGKVGSCPEGEVLVLCKDTAKEDENCYFKDRCNYLVIDYSGWRCSLAGTID